MWFNPLDIEERITPRSANFANSANNGIGNAGTASEISGISEISNGTRAKTITPSAEISEISEISNGDEVATNIMASTDTPSPAGQQLKATAPAAISSGLLVTVWTPAGNPMQVLADSPEHAAWLVYMNPKMPNHGTGF